ncbi:hypothetical protein P9112_006092 [Eukaryota sp. TZLM1-RC]
MVKDTLDLKILNGTIVTPTESYVGDVGVKDGKITIIGESLSDVVSTDTVDASGKLILPAAIDCHTHFEMPFGGTVSRDGYESGSRAALSGGCSCYIDFVIQGKGESLRAALKRRQDLAATKSCCDYAFHIAITDLNESILAEMEEIVQEEGVNSFKVFMVYDFAVDDGVLCQVLQRAAQVGGRVSIHCENKPLIDYNVKKFLSENKTSPYYHYLSRDEDVESEAVKRVVHFAKAFKAPIYIVHLACKDGLKEVERAHAEGYQDIVIAETCPQYLAFTSDVYKRDDGQNFVLSPPIKGQESQDALWDGIQRGIIRTVATDHCSFLSEEKLWGKNDFSKIPNGAGGIELLYPYMLSEANKGRITFNKAVELCSANVAQLFGIKNKGSIRVGADADIVIYDPSQDFVVTKDKLHDDNDHIIYEGMELKGCVSMTFCRGVLAFKDGEFMGKSGFGRFVKRVPLSSSK